MAASAAGRRSRIRFSAELLEDRLLLTGSGVYPGYITGAAPATTPLEQAQAAAIRDVQGPTLTGGDGPLAKIGFDLAEVYEEYKLFQAGADGSSTTFQSSNTELQVRNGEVALDADTSGNVQPFETTLSALGMTELATTSEVVSGWFPIQYLNALPEVSGLQFARADTKPVVRAGSVESQGDTAIEGPTARSTYGVDGTGITVGIISDSFDTSGTGSAAADVASGDLPAAGVDVLGDSPGGTDEGRAMTQIVHDVAPGAAIQFDASGISETTFAQSILALQAAGSQVIADDIGYNSEPFFQDGVSGQAIDKVASEGVAYFSAAGNDGDASYQAPFNASTVTGPAGGMLQNFGTSSSVVTQQQVNVPVGDEVPFILQWTQPFQSLGGAGATSQLNIYLLDSTGTIIAQANDPVIGSDPIQEMDFANDGSYGPSGGETAFTVEIELASGPAPSLIKYIGNDDGAGFSITNAVSGTAYGHPNVAGAISVGAAAYYNTPAFGVTPALLESFSSPGGIPTYFDDSGNLLPSPVINQNPAVTGPDGVNTTFFDPTPPGVTLPSNPVPYNFFGTSAATPHVAAVAALMLQEAGGPGSLTPDEVRTILEESASPISERTDGSNPGSPVTAIPGGGAINYYAGYGLVNADTAVKLSQVQPPVAVDDTATTAENTPVAINVLANDTPGGKPIAPSTVAIVQQPADGTLQVDPKTGVVTYVPDTNFAGDDSFTYTVSDTAGNVSNVATVSITVTFVDRPPTAGNDIASTNPGTPVTINVLANDYPFSSLAALVPSTLTIVQQPLNGTARIVNNEIVYTPAAGFVGGDSFQYTVADNYGLASNVATVAIRTGAAVEISGFAYVDTNGDGQKESGEVGIPGVTVELTKTDGNYTFTTFALTGADGAYHFVEGANYIMPAGTYTVKEIQPGFFVPGLASNGTPAAAGPNSNSQFSNITLAAGEQGTDYDFGAQGLSAEFAAAYYNRRAFLASTGPTFTGLDPQNGPNWVSFDAGVEGTLTAVAQFNPALGSVNLTLLNSAMNAVATSTSSGGQAELSFSGQSTGPYFLELTGTNSNVSLHAYAPAPQVSSPPPVQPQLHNFSNPLDVNGDGIVSALDALAIINDLNAGEFGPLSGLNLSGSEMVDVNDDGQLTALDALQVINDLNSTSAAAAASAIASATLTPAAVDSVLSAPAAVTPALAAPSVTSSGRTPSSAASAGADVGSVAFALAAAQSLAQAAPAACPASTSTGSGSPGGTQNGAGLVGSAAVSSATSGLGGIVHRSSPRSAAGNVPATSRLWSDQEF